MLMLIRVTEEEKRAVPCPRCCARAGQPCRGSRIPPPSSFGGGWGGPPDLARAHSERRRAALGSSSAASTVMQQEDEQVAAALRELFKGDARYLQFIDDMTAAGIPVRSYTGRGMFGKCCPAACTSKEVALHDIMRATKVPLTTDSMGRGVVCYVR